MNGCICCTVRGDLVEALKRLHKKVEKFDAVLIETTGMADPAPVAQTFFVDETIQELYKLDGIVTVVDAVNIEQHLDKEVKEVLFENFPTFRDGTLGCKLELGWKHVCESGCKRFWWQKYAAVENCGGKRKLIS